MEKEPQPARRTASIAVQSGRRCRKTLSSAGQSSGFYTKLEETGEVGKDLPGNVGPSSLENDAPFPSESDPADCSTTPLIGKGPRMSASKRKKLGSRAHPMAAGGAGGSQGYPGTADHTSEIKGLSQKRTSQVAHFTVLSDDDQRLLKRRGKKREQIGGTERKRNVLKKYKEDVERAFRRGWEHFLSNLYRVVP
ncbi:uncharacterized protein LOC144670408 [Cetorhinus maximus]